MKNIILATAGHIDHGKSTLIKNLTGKYTMHHKEEKIRNITIDLGYANLKTRELNINIIDVPGHRDYLKNTICGILNANVILLVISAKDGLCKQTYEHFEIINYCRIENLIIAITKTDIADSQMIQNTISQSQNLIKNSSIKNTDIAIIDYEDKNSLNNLIDKIYNLSLNINIPKSDKTIFRIDNSFTVKGYGTVISGNLISGKLNNQDELMIYPQKLKTKIKNLQNNQKNIESSNSFSRLAINISNIEKSKVNRGNIASTSFDIQSTNIIDVLVATSDLKRNIKNYEFVKIYTGTANITGKIINLQDKITKPNTKTIIQLRLQENITCFLKDDIIILDTSLNDIIAGGQIINTNPSKKSKFDILLPINIDKIIILSTIKEKKISDVNELSKLCNMSIEIIQLYMDELVEENHIIEIKSKYSIDKNKNNEKINLYDTNDCLGIDYEAQIIISKDFFEKIKIQISNLINEYSNKFIYRNSINLNLIYTKLNYMEIKFINIIISYMNFEIKDNNLIIKREGLKQDINFKKKYEFLKYELDSSTKPIMIKTLIKDDKLSKEILYTELSDNFRQISNEYICSKKNLDLYLNLINKHFETKKTLSLSEFKEYTYLSRNLSVIILEYFDMQKITKRFENYRTKRYNNTLS